MENIYVLTEKNGVDFSIQENPIAVFLKKDKWVAYSNQESSIAVEILCEYFDIVAKQNEEVKEEKIEQSSIDKQIEEFIFAQPTVEKQIPIQQQIQESIADLNLQYLMKKILNLNEIIRCFKITDRTNVAFLKRKYNNASFTQEEWENIFSKESIYIA